VQDPTERLLVEEEDRVPYVYPDSLGFSTIGVGHLVDKRKGGGLPDEIITALLRLDIQAARAYLSHAAGESCLAALNAVQIAALVSMAFQLGQHSMDGFKTFLRCLRDGDVKGAAAAGRDSLWDRQTHARAEREMKMLESGLWVPKGGV
jgi:lysozyme